jgi:MFS family permease
VRRRRSWWRSNGRNRIVAVVPGAMMPGMSSAVKTGSGLVLGVLAASQFLMTLDSSVMNVSMATVAADLGTTITGIQTAITCFTLVMATLMITGGKIGSILGRRRAFGIGLVIYAFGSFTTALAPNLGVLLIGWSLLEGIGAALIMPAVVGLVATNFPAEKRASSYGLIAAASAMAVAAGPLIGGAVTTFASWRYIFLGEVVIVVTILLSMRKISDSSGVPAKLDLFGSLLSVVGLGMFVFGVLRSGQWGFITPKSGAPAIFGVSPVLWLMALGLSVVYGFLRWEAHLVVVGRDPLLRAELLKVPQLSGGLTMFFVQFLVQSGVFFAVPLFLSVVLELTPLETGIRIFPLSIALLVAAAGIPRIFPRTSPRLVVRIGLVLMIAGILNLMAGMDPGVSASIVTIPMILLGLGLGALASQLGAVAVSSVPENQSSAVGGLQNTATNLGASLGTALIGSALIATLSSSVALGIANRTDIPEQVKVQASSELVGGIPFVSDTQLTAALAKAGITGPTAAAVLDVNAQARLDGLRAAFGLAALVGIAGLFFLGRIPEDAPGTSEQSVEAVPV